MSSPFTLMFSQLIGTYSESLAFQRLPLPMLHCKLRQQHSSLSSSNRYSQMGPQQVQHKHQRRKMYSPAQGGCKSANTSMRAGMRGSDIVRINGFPMILVLMYIFSCTPIDHTRSYVTTLLVYLCQDF
ncbi:hypothetical protein BDQ17DRAFT_673699 [Cyathus striatus]|nr:hypothetical protein BDQ17DRAFT_673699 [Cyathus striatus]